MQNNDREVVRLESFAGKSLRFDDAKDVRLVVGDMIEQLSRRSSPSRIHVQLSGNTIGVLAAEELSKTLKQISSLSSIDLSDVFTGRLVAEVPIALSHFCQALEDKQYLHEVNFSHNAFGPACTESLSQLLKRNHNIKCLKVKNNGLGICGGTIIADALSARSKQNTLPSITRFEAGRNRLENLGAIRLADAFKRIGTLEALHLPQNGIFPEGIAAIAEGISNNASNFTELNLSDNVLRVEGAVSLANVLRKMKTLKYLNLGDCLLTSNGGIIILEAIADNTNLEHLDLIYNDLDDRAAPAILKAISNKQNLKRLELSGNQFSSKTLETIRSILTGTECTLSVLSDNDEAEEVGYF